MGDRNSLRDRAVAGTALTVLRRVAQQFASGPLPEWSTFVESTSLRTYPARTTVPMGVDDLALTVRGLVKLVNDDTGRVEEFLGSGTMIAASVRPRWATRSVPPFSVARWLGQRWSIPPMSVVTLDRTALLHFDYRVVETLASRHVEWGQVHAAFLWNYIDALFVAGRGALEKDVAVRYAELTRQRGLEGKATQRDIASYLNITESALSRIIRRTGRGETT